MGEIKPKERAYFIDILRGVSIIFVVLYHALFNLAYIYELSWALNFLNHPILVFLQIFISSTFITLAGITCSFSRNNLKRGIMVLACGYLITIITLIFIPENAIYFGILHCIGALLILYSITQKFLPRWFYNPFWFFAFIIVYPIMKSVEVKISHLYWLGFPDVNFTSADYFPIFPYVLIFCFGLWLGKVLKEKTIPQSFTNLRCPPLEWMGRHTLIIYLAHQPIIYTLMFLFFNYIAK